MREGEKPQRWRSGRELWREGWRWSQEREEGRLGERKVEEGRREKKKVGNEGGGW